MSGRDMVGDTPRRREDARFVTGHGAYVDDLVFPDLCHAVVLRSPHAHAVIASMDATVARAAPGVFAVLTAVEVATDGLHPLPPTVVANVKTGEPFAYLPQPLLAREKVRYCGEPVALIVAATKAQALDAAELVHVDYASLSAVTSADAARAPGAVQIADGVPDNVCLDWRIGDEAGADEIFARAAHNVTMRLNNHRIVTNPMEPRGGVGAVRSSHEAVYAASVQPEHTY